MPSRQLPGGHLADLRSEDTGNIDIHTGECSRQSAEQEDIRNRLAVNLLAAPAFFLIIEGYVDGHVEPHSDSRELDAVFHLVCRVDDICKNERGHQQVEAHRVLC